MCYSVIKITRPKWLVIQKKKVQLSSKASIALYPSILEATYPEEIWKGVQLLAVLLGEKL